MCKKWGYCCPTCKCSGRKHNGKDPNIYAPYHDTNFPYTKECEKYLNKNWDHDERCSGTAPPKNGIEVKGNDGPCANSLTQKERSEANKKRLKQEEKRLESLLKGNSGKDRTVKGTKPKKKSAAKR